MSDDLLFSSQMLTVFVYLCLPGLRSFIKHKGIKPEFSKRILRPVFLTWLSAPAENYSRGVLCSSYFCLVNNRAMQESQLSRLSFLIYLSFVQLARRRTVSRCARLLSESGDHYSSRKPKPVHLQDRKRCRCTYHVASAFCRTSGNLSVGSQRSFSMINSAIPHSYVTRSLI